MPMKRWQAVASKYHNLQPEGVHSIGRAGSYRYEVDIDDCIRQAMILWKLYEKSASLWK